MIEFRLRRLLELSVAAGCILLLLFTACSEKSGGTRAPNIPPETSIAFAPTEDSLTYYKVQAYWFGTDADGDVDYFQVKTIKNVERSDFGEDFDWDTVGVWTETSSRESLFVLEADSCCLGEGENSSALAAWGLFVRAVDDQGAVSEKPAMVFFKAGNAIPKVKIVVPEKIPIPFIDVPSHPYIEWEGEDPDGDPSQLQYKYLVIPAEDVNDTYPRYPPFSHEGSGGGHASPEIGTWSEWVPADCTSVRDLDLSLYRGTQELVWVFTTVKDEGGAELGEKLFVGYNNASNGIRLLVLETGAGVTTIIDGGSLGRRSSMQVTEYQSNIAGVFLGTEMSFRFWAEEEPGRGEIAESYRYYWDSPEDPGSSWNYWTGTAPIRDPGLAPSWVVRYPTDGGRLSPSLGRHVFVVELKDLNQVISHCEFHLEILEGPRRAPEKKILLVDDDRVQWLEPWWGLHEPAQDELWTDILSGYNWEEFDTGPEYQYELPIRMVDQATTVIWVVDQDIEAPITQLLQVCSLRGNYLQSYVNVGGNLILIGRDPSYASGYWPDGTPPYYLRPNQRNWDFSPKVDQATGEMLYNWNWEIFGIEKMAQASPAKPYSALWPCDDCAEAFADTIEMGEQAERPGVDGAFENAFYITELREDFNVVPLFSTAIKNTSGEWTTSGDDYIAVYAPGDDQRGHAVYIGAPEYWFDHAKIKNLIRKLLEEFGEEPVGY
jgi:hypothetical protein